MNYDWENPSLQHKNRLPGRSSFFGFPDAASALKGDALLSPFVCSLDGEWDFFLAPSPLLTPPRFEEGELDENTQWSRITVPGCWQMQGWGIPVYSASPYLFPTDPPYVAADNDTGCYLRRFTLPESMKNRPVTLRFEGVGSMFYVYVNGHEAGMSKGAHMAAEFDVTPLLREGENTLCVKVLRFSDGSYLEIQDMYHMSGIFRSVYLLAWPEKGRAEDIFVQADSTGALSVCVSGVSGFSGVLYDGETSCASLSEGQNSVQVEDPHLWSAEDPYLYRLVIQVEDEFFPIFVGFRTVEIRDSQLLVNGKAIKAKGVNHHDTNTQLGWAVSHEALETDVLLMKRHNINFVRTSHYPSDPYFYDLCDRYGIYVLDEADIECHGMGITDVNILSSDRDWEYAYVDRAQRMVLRDRCHPCVIVWSMGNESGFGENFRSVSKAIKELDGGRPVHYAGAKDLPSLIPEEVAKDPEKMYQMREARMKQPWDPCVDMASTMYMSPTDLEKEGEKEDPLPFLVCEYAHSMGNGPGSLKEYWEVIYRHPRLIGACVWEWQDHGILRFTDEGKKYYAGGYDLHMPYKRDGINGNFCNDGLLSPEKVPHPGLIELKKALQPLYFELVRTDPVTLRVTSRYQFISGETVGHWELKKDALTFREGELNIDDLAPGETKEYVLPVSSGGEEAFLNLSFVLRHSTSWAPRGHEVACEQFLLGSRAIPQAPKSEEPLHGKRQGFVYTVTGGNFSLSFDLLHGYLSRWESGGKEVLAMPMKQNYWRAPTDNDVGIVGPMRPGAANNWKDNGLDRLIPRNLQEPEIKEEKGKITLTFRQRWGAHPFPCVLDNEMSYTVYPEGSVDVSVSYRQLDTPYLKEDFWWPRLGFTLGIGQAFDTVSWHGRGPGENYSDRCWASNIGWYQKKVTELHTSYSRMQENGARTDCRSLRVENRRGQGLSVTALSAPFTFTCHDYTDAALTEAWHEYELKRAGCTVVDIDLCQSGLGSNSCGPEPMTRYKPTLTSGDVSFTFRMKAE